MEKRTPHYKLALVRQLLSDGKVRTTFSALRGAAELGLDFAAMVQAVSTLSPADFHKSMTTHDDHRTWQDVYRPAFRAGAIYLKLTVVDDVLVVSFKEL